MSGADNRSGPRAGRGRPGRERSGRGRPGRVAPPPGLDAVHGVHAVETLFRLERYPRVLWLQQGPAQRRLEPLAAEAARLSIPVAVHARETLDALAEGAHQGVIAFCEPLVPESEATLFWHLEACGGETPALLLVLDGVTDVHNFGACLRSADAAGASGVIVARDRSAPLGATVRKIACGGAESVPVYQVTNLARVLAKLREVGVRIVGAAGEAKVCLFDADLGQPTALVMGAEGKGLRRLTREHCDTLIRLPMAGQVSSLNVSVATGICLFEAVRQRRRG